MQLVMVYVTTYVCFYLPQFIRRLVLREPADVDHLLVLLGRLDLHWHVVVRRHDLRVIKLAREGASLGKCRGVADLLEVVAEPAFEQFSIFMEKREQETVQHGYGIPPALTDGILAVDPS